MHTAQPTKSIDLICFEKINRTFDFFQYPMLWARQRTGAPVPAHHGAFHILLADDSGEDSSSSTSDPRDRARAVRRRRKQLNAGVGKKIRRNAGYLAHVVGVCVTMFTSHTAGIVGGPLSDVWAVVKPRHHTTPTTTRAAMMFCGRARSWKTRRRGAAYMPRDLLYGHDLRNPAAQRCKKHLGGALSPGRLQPAPMAAWFQRKDARGR